MVWDQCVSMAIVCHVHALVEALQCACDRAWPRLRMRAHLPRHPHHQAQLRDAQERHQQQGVARTAFWSARMAERGQCRRRQVNAAGRARDGEVARSRMEEWVMGEQTCGSVRGKV